MYVTLALAENLNQSSSPGILKVTVLQLPTVRVHVVLGSETQSLRVFVGVGVEVLVGVTDMVGVTDGVTVGVGVVVGVTVGVFVVVGVTVGVLVGVTVGVGVGVAGSVLIAKQSIYALDRLLLFSNSQSKVYEPAESG